MVLTESTKTLARSDSKLLRLKLPTMKSFIEISTTRLSIFFNSRNRISRSNRSRSDRFDAPFSKRLSVGKIGRPNRREKLSSRNSPRMSIRKRWEPHSPDRSPHPLEKSLVAKSRCFEITSPSIGPSSRLEPERKGTEGDGVATDNARGKWRPASEIRLGERFRPITI